MRLNLDHARRSVASQERAHNRGRHTHRLQDGAELRVRDIADGLIEIRMVEQIEKLQAHADFGAFPVWDVEILHDGEVRVEEVRPVELVSALRTKPG